MPDGALPETFVEIERTWRPEDTVAVDVIRPEPSQGFAALLDADPPVNDRGDALPTLWHWFHFAEPHPQAALGEDGHLRDSAFLPPLQDRRRMFGGGRLEVTAPLLVGDEVERRSSLGSVRTTMGGSGPLLLTTVRQEFLVAGARRLVEEQDIVYRRARDVGRASRTTPDPAAVPPGEVRLQLQPDPVLLFRFSALTNNAHRIHYDRDYATQVEGYPGLVVHGPLLALLLLEPSRRDAAAVRSFAWRARRPVFDDQRVDVAVQPSGGVYEVAVGTEGYWPVATGTVEPADAG
ncbi:MAG: hypothetical protein WD638_04705 [Nitriliruptoraceae bacterium]